MFNDDSPISYSKDKVIEICKVKKFYRSSYIQGGPKMAQFLYALTLPNINGFSKLFLSQNQEKILTLKIPPHLKCVADSEIILKIG